MMAGTPTGNVAGDRILLPVAQEFWWLPGSRISNGKAMPNRAALIEAQIPGLRRFACALLRGDQEASNQHRVRRRGPHDALTETELPGIDGGQYAALEHRDLLRAFAALPQEQRAVLLLVGVEDVSYQEAARVLGVPIGTVMSRLSRGRERLRRSLHGELDEDSPHCSAAPRRVR